MDWIKWVTVFIGWLMSFIGYPLDRQDQIYLKDSYEPTKDSLSPTNVSVTEKNCQACYLNVFFLLCCIIILLKGSLGAMVSCCHVTKVTGSSCRISSLQMQGKAACYKPIQWPFLGPCCIAGPLQHQVALLSSSSLGMELMFMVVAEEEGGSKLGKGPWRERCGGGV